MRRVGVACRRKIILIETFSCFTAVRCGNLWYMYMHLFLFTGDNNVRCFSVSVPVLPRPVYFLFGLVGSHVRIVLLDIHCMSLSCSGAIGCTFFLDYDPVTIYIVCLLCLIF